MFATFESAAVYCEFLEETCEQCRAKPIESPMGDSWFATYSLSIGLHRLPREIKQNFENAVRVE